VFCSLQDHLRTGTCDLDHPVLAGPKNIDSWHARKEDLHHAFPLDVPMVSSSSIAIAANGERLTCGGFSLGEIVRLGNFEFITDYIGSLSLSPRRGDAGAAFMGSTHSEASTTWRAIIVDSTKEFLMAPREVGSFGLPSTRRRSMGASLAPITTTTQMENAPAAKAMMTFPCGWWHRGRKPASLSRDVTLITGGNRCKPMLSSPLPSKRQRHDEASSLASKPLPRFNRVCHCGASPHSR
jgi:hypothetical protein